MNDRGPVFVVGLPRSGSTLLSRLLNDAGNILSVNDLYCVQAAIAGKMIDRTLDDHQAARLVDQILSVISLRSVSSDAFIGQICVPPAQLSSIRDAVLLRRCGPRRWHELMNDTLTRVAASAGKSVWADKTPQNFLHIDMLRGAFAGARFVFLIRDPRSVLASYKFARGEGHDRRRYHPLPYSIYWRKAARRYLEKRHDPDILLIRYEELIRAPERTTSQLARFLGTTIPTPRLMEIGHNSSFAAGTRQQLTHTETWICEKTCHQEIEALGYPITHARPELADTPGIAFRGLRFCSFQLTRYIANTDARSRIDGFFRQIR